MASPAESLARISIFSSAPPKELAKLAKDVHERTFPAGTRLTDQDEFGTMFMVIEEGRATVSVGGATARTLGPGDFFGEMALIDREPRSATITAETDLRCLLLTQWVFRPFALNHPETMWSLLELMVQRVRDAEAARRG